MKPDSDSSFANGARSGCCYIRPHLNTRAHRVCVYVIQICQDDEEDDDDGVSITNKACGCIFTHPQVCTYSHTITNICDSNYVAVYTVR